MMHTRSILTALLGGAAGLSVPAGSAAAQTCTELGFFRADTSGTSGRKNDIDVQDINNDGLLDLVTVRDSGFPPDTFISENTGDEFSPFPSSAVRTVDAGDTPGAVALGDLNGDGDIDIVAANGGFIGGGPPAFDLIPDTVSVLLGNGDFTFQDPVEYTAGGSNLTEVELADIDRDGDLDVVTTERNTESVTIFTNDGFGVLTVSQALSNIPGENGNVGDDPFLLRFADFDGDGFPDFVVGGRGEVILYLNDGTGLFTNEGVLLLDPTGDFPDLAVGDVDRDGLIDLITERDRSDVAILLNNGDGTFSETTVDSGGSRVNDLALADINGDYIDDIVVAADGPVTVLIGNGDGTFQPGESDLNFENEFEDAVQVVVENVDGFLGPDVFVRQRGDSDTPVVLLNQCPGVPSPDLDGTDGVTFFDLLAFLAAFDADESLADFNDSGSVNDSDLMAYIAAYGLTAVIAPPSS